MNIARLDRRGTVRPILITGGCGFLGCNIAAELARRGRDVIAFDNLARAGAQEHAGWLTERFGDRISIIAADVREEAAVSAVVRSTAAVLHLAAQVAVTTSLDDPVEDFEVNARGTLNVLEAVRRHNPQAPVLFASTNKVYGRLFDDGAVGRSEQRYAPLDTNLSVGIDEAAALDFHSPYGCSKGTADQYVRDYARVFGLRTVVLRMSCIYGPRQFGTEDQGWIAHFLIRAIRGEPITIYGDGCQVRDALFVDDAVDAWLRALERADDVSGQAFNLGGGPANSASLREMIDLIARLRGRRPQLRFADWRPGDQPWYVSDVRAISRALDWRPRTPLPRGLAALDGWLTERFAPTAPASRLQEAQA